MHCVCLCVVYGALLEKVTTTDHSNPTRPSAPKHSSFRLGRRVVPAVAALVGWTLVDIQQAFLRFDKVGEHSHSSPPFLEFALTRYITRLPAEPAARSRVCHIWQGLSC